MTQLQQNLTPADIEKLVYNALNKRAQENVYNVNPIPVHSHTGTDSPQIDPTNLSNVSLYFNVRNTTLNSSQILALNTTPITLVPATIPTTSSTNPNAVIIVEGITAKIYAGSTAYTGANNLEFRYTNGSGTKVTADIANTFINTTANTVAYNHVAGIITAFTPVANTPIVVSVPTANPATGNGSIVFSVKYRIITL